MDQIDRIESIRKAGAAMMHLHNPIRPPRDGDWLSEYEEPGQTFLEYLASDPVLPTRELTALCI